MFVPHYENVERFPEMDERRTIDLLEEVGDYCSFDDFPVFVEVLLLALLAGCRARLEVEYL